MDGILQSRTIIIIGAGTGLVLILALFLTLSSQQNSDMIQENDDVADERIDIMQSMLQEYGFILKQCQRIETQVDYNQVVDDLNVFYEKSEFLMLIEFDELDFDLLDSNTIQKIVKIGEQGISLDEKIDTCLDTKASLLWG